MTAKVDACLHAVSTVENAAVLFESAAKRLYAEDMGKLGGLMVMHAHELRHFLDKVHDHIEAKRDLSPVIEPGSHRSSLSEVGNG